MMMRENRFGWYRSSRVGARRFVGSRLKGFQAGPGLVSSFVATSTSSHQSPTGSGIKSLITTTLFNSTSLGSRSSLVLSRHTVRSHQTPPLNLSGRGLLFTPPTHRLSIVEIISKKKKPPRHYQVLQNALSNAHPRFIPNNPLIPPLSNRGSVRWTLPRSKTASQTWTRPSEYQR